MDFGSSSSRLFPPYPTTNFQEDEEDQTENNSNSVLFIEKEQMFDKVVTPSDVGKLNRLVIPKQHAEKYFPLDSSSNEKGLLLNFEDRTGKSWRFRYSYWTSSQSYVMTKGWSRFVKEKRLDAGDIVSFQRGVGQFCKDRFFIDWRRRPPPPHTAVVNFHHGGGSSGGGGGGEIVPRHFQVWSPVAVATPLSLHRDHVFHLPQDNSNHNYNVSLFHDNTYTYNHYYHHRHHQNHLLDDGGSGFYPSPAAVIPPPQETMVPVAAAGGGVGRSGAGKTLRLFGVDMECAASEDSEEDECGDVITTSSTTMSSTSQFRVYDGMPMSMPMSMPMQIQMSMFDHNNNVPTTTDFNPGKGKSPMSSSDFGT